MFGYFLMGIGGLSVIILVIGFAVVMFTIEELNPSEFTSFVQGKNPKYEDACYIDFSQPSPEQNIKSQDISLNRAMHAKPGELLHIGNRRIIACDGFFMNLFSERIPNKY